MRHANLSLAQTPPLSVPMRFFLTAPLFVIGCGVIVYVNAPQVLLSRWAPELLAATHLMTLGFLAMIMIGALQQLMPVLMGVSIPRPELFSVFVHVLLTLGTAALAGGWLLSQVSLFVLASLLLGAAISLFVVVLLFQLLSSSTRGTPGGVVILALLAFVVTLALGVSMLWGYLQPDWWRLPRMTDLHMTWGLLGWVTLLIVTIAGQVVPMFQITPDYPVFMGRWFGRLMWLLLLVWAVALVLLRNMPEWRVAVEMVIGAGLLLFLVLTLRLLHKRRRRMPDVTLNFWRTSMFSLLLAVLAWMAANLVADPRLGILTGVAMVLGFAMSAISGMLYKIVPFLVWLHLNNRMQSQGRFQGRVPNMKRVIPERNARLHFRVHLLMLLLVLPAVFWPDYLLRPAALALVLAGMLMFWNLISALLLYMKTVSPRRVE